MHESALPPEQRRALLALKPLADRGFYLAGGSALCLRLAHRRSIDLDLFREVDFEPQQLQRELEAQGLVLANARSKPSTLWFELYEVPISVMRFPYPSLQPPEPGLCVPVASLEERFADSTPQPRPPARLFPWIARRATCRDTVRSRSRTPRGDTRGALQA